MRLIRDSLALGALLLVAAAAACGDHPTGDELVVRAAEPIQGGTVDTGDPAVVGIVINTGGGIAICSGSLIAPNLVLTAHHCVSQTPSSTSGCSTTASFGGQYAATSFRVTSSYNAAASAFNTGSFPSVDSKTWFGAAKVTVAGSDICGGDMAVIELSKSMTGICPIIPRVDSAVANSEAYRAVGFGITSPSGAAAGTRYAVSGLSVLCASSCGAGLSSTLEWIGGSSASKGTCEGDSGGPALDAAGRVIGTVSRGPASSCNQTVYEGTFGQAAWIKQMAKQAATDGGYAVAGWANGGATSDAANGYCGTTGGDAGTGTDAGTPDTGTPDTGTPDTGTPDTGSGGGATGACAAAGTTCIDASGGGDYGCFASGPSFPTGAAGCSGSVACPAGYSCWGNGAGATSGFCVQDCTPGGTGTTDAGTGGGATDTGTGGGAADTGTGGGKADTGTGTDTTPDTGVDPGTDATPDPGADAGAAADAGHKTVLANDTASAGACALGGAAGARSGSGLAWVAVALAGALAARRRRG